MGVSPLLTTGGMHGLRTSKTVGRSTVHFQIHRQVCLAVDLSRPDIISIWMRIYYYPITGKL